MTNRKRLVIPGVALGVLILILAVMFRSSPKLEAGYDSARLVEWTTLQRQSVQPVLNGYGRIEPKHVWQAIAEVSGAIVYRHAELETGRFMPAGTEVLRVDPLEYQLKLAQAEANLNSSKAQLTRLEQESDNLQRSLTIEQQKLDLAEQEFKRKQNLNKQGLVSNSEVESEQQALLAQRNKVVDMQSAISLLPDDRKVTEAQIKVNQSLLSDAQRLLDKTSFTLPFDSRIASVNIEQAQAVSMGNILFEAHQLGTVEVKAEFSLKDMRTLASSLSRVQGSASLPAIDQLNLTAFVYLDEGNKRHSWPARVTRVSDSVNPDQATVGVFLEIDQDFRKLDFVNRPPLTKGMFVTAEVRGFASQQLVVPERALHGGALYLMSDDDTLEIIQVDVLFRTAQGVAVNGELKDGVRLVLNDLIPAVEGMQLRTQDNQQGGAR